MPLLEALPSRSRILILRLRSIGDIVLLTPAIRLVKEWRPDLRLSVAVEDRFRELLEAHPQVDGVVPLSLSKGWRSNLSRLQCAANLRRRDFALCLDLHGGPTSQFLTLLSGAAWKAGFEHFRHSRLYHVLIPDARLVLGQPRIHTAEHQAAALFWLGVPRGPIPLAQLYVQDTHRRGWNRRRASLGLTAGGDYALIHPTALYETKQWAPEKFAQLGEYLVQAVNLPTIYSCGMGESGALDEVERAAGRRLARLDGAPLGEFAAALAEARLFVGNDSGPAHMARALGRPSVVIFGSSSSVIWGPWPPPSSIPHAPGPTSGPACRVVQNDYNCNPCPGDRCYRFAKPECILSVSFEQVRKAVDEVLNAAQSVAVRA